MHLQGTWPLPKTFQQEETYFKSHLRVTRGKWSANRKHPVSVIRSIYICTYKYICMYVYQSENMIRQFINEFPNQEVKWNEKTWKTYSRTQSLTFKRFLWGKTRPLTGSFLCSEKILFWYSTLRQFSHSLRFLSLSFSLWQSLNICFGEKIKWKQQQSQKTWISVGQK